MDWISVKDRLPTHKEGRKIPWDAISENEYLVLCRFNGTLLDRANYVVCIYNSDNDEFTTDRRIKVQPSEWMSIPE